MDTIRLGELVTIHKGKKANRVFKERISGGERYIQIKDLRSDDKLEFTDDKKMVFVDENDIVVAWDGSNAGTIGFNLNGAIGSTLAKLKIKREQSHKFNPQFIGWFLKSIHREINQNTSGIAIPHINKSYFDKIRIPSLPLDQQNQTVAILNNVERFLYKQKESFKSLKELSSNLFIGMFGDPYINPKNYPVHPLKRLVDSDKIITYGIVQAGPVVDDGIYYIRSGDIKYGGIAIDQLQKTSYNIANKYERSKCNEGDIVMSIRATVGLSAVIPKDLDGCNLTQGTARISPDKKIINGNYLFNSIMSKGIQEFINYNAKGATFKEITLTTLREIKIPLPPLDEQELFANKYLKIKAFESKYKSAIELTNTLFKAIIQKAFTGEDITNESQIFEDILPTLSIKDFLDKKIRIDYLIDLLQNKKIKKIETYEKAKAFTFNLLQQHPAPLEQYYDPKTKTIKFKIIK